MGHKVKEITKKRLHRANKGQVPWNKGGHLTKQDRRNKSIAALRRAALRRTTLRRAAKKRKLFKN
jgi:hypothetical protein